MPYIKPEGRSAIDELIQPLIDHLKNQPLENQDGDLNYAITRIIHELYPEKYFHYNRAIGVLSSVELELYRKKVAPYEDKKILENGEV